MPSGSNALGAWLIGVSTAMFLAYAGTVRLVWRRHGRAAVVVVAGAAVSCLALSVLALPTHTSDVYDYALFARVQTVHDGRTYEDFPDKYPNDPVYPFASHQYTGKVDNKLPAWTLFSMGVSTLAGDGPVANLMAYRLALAALSAGSALLVVFILRRTKPHAMLSGLAVLALNPIFAVYGTGKTDALMVFLLLGGFALLTAGHRRWAVVALALSSLVKLITLPVLILYWLGQLVRSRRDAAIDVVLILAATVVCYLPFSGLDLMREQATLVGDSGSSLPHILRPVASLVFFVALLAAGLVRLPPPRAPDRNSADTMDLVRRCVPIMLFFGLFLTKLGLPWYLLTLVAIAAIAANGFAVAAIITLSWSSFVFGWWYSVNTPRYPLPDLFSGYRLPLYLAPAVIVMVAAVAAGRRRYSLR